MKKVFAMLLALAMLLTACNAKQSGAPGTNNSAGQGNDSGAPTVGILLPDEQQPHWVEQGTALTQKLQAMGYETVLTYAGNDPQRQNTQLQDMIKAQTDCLVIAAVDSLALTDSVARAKAAGIPVVAYDRLLMQTDGVTCYVGFDSYAAGIEVGAFLEESRLLQTAGEESRSYTVEFFMDSPENHSALEFYRGVLSVLQTYLDSGVLVCPSGYLSFEDTCVQDGSAELAAEQCAYLLGRCYTEKMPDILLTASDTLASGVCAALDAVNCPAEQWPLITGQNVGEETAARLLAGKQAMTTLSETEVLTEACAQQVQALLTQQQLAINDTTTCDNGIMNVPSQLFRAETVTAENCEQLIAN